MSMDFYNRMREIARDPNRKVVQTTPEQWQKLNEAIQDPAMREKLKAYVPMIESRSKDQVTSNPLS